ncbi:hypothetical protein D3C81_1024910 [compost metagenome]
MGVADQAGQRLQAELAGALLFGQHHGGGAVVEAGGIARGDGAVFLLEDRLHRGQLLEAEVAAHMLVAGEADHAFARLQLHRNDLLLEIAFGNGPRGAALAFQGEGILLFTADAIARGDVFRGDTHVGLLPGVVEDAVHVVDGAAIAEARAPAQAGQDERAAAHALRAGADGDVGIAQQDGLGGGNDRLQTRAAQAVDVEGGGFLGNAGVHGGYAAQIGIAWLGRDHVAQYDMADFARVDPGALQGCAAGRGRQRGQGGVLERTAEGADGGAGCTDYENLTLSHGVSLLLSGQWAHKAIGLSRGAGEQGLAELIKKQNCSFVNGLAALRLFF